MKVLFFAQSREATGCAEFFLPVQGALNPSEFWTELINRFPALQSLRKSARLARNETYLQTDETLQPGDEIAVIPPVSGG